MVADEKNLGFIENPNPNRVENKEFDLRRDFYSKHSAQKDDDIQSSCGFTFKSLKLDIDLEKKDFSVSYRSMGKVTFYTTRTSVKSRWSMSEILDHAQNATNSSRTVCIDMGFIDADCELTDYGLRIYNNDIIKINNACERVDLEEFKTAYNHSYNKSFSVILVPVK